MDKVKSEIYSAPVLFPYSPEIFWEQLRKILREELEVMNAINPAAAFATPGMENKPLYKIEELCKMFSVSKPTIYEWIKQGTLRPFKVHSRVFFLWEDVRGLWREKK
jgi:excisionase family DNA binding protein